MIEWIKNIENSGKMDGLMDDRGKYIVITREEMDKMAMYIKRRGRVSIEEIAKESNRLIKLN